MTFVTKSNGKNKDSYNVNDIVMTPNHIAKFIIDKFYDGKGSILDPFKGEGAFYNQFPDVEKDWNEISEGRDFFNEHRHFDWIISNPPYSKFTEVMQHSYEIANNIVYLIPLNKIVSSWGRVKDLNKFGGIKHLYILPAGKCGFPFGFPACACWIQKDYHGPVIWEIENDK